MTFIHHTIKRGSKPLIHITGDKPKRNHNGEALIQRAILEWFWLVMPGALIWHIPNGGLRSKREAARLKWQGVVAGIPDLAFVYEGVPYFFEVKTKGNYPSPEQKDIIQKLQNNGAKVAVVRSIDDARAALELWNILTKESSNGLHARPE